MSYVRPTMSCWPTYDIVRDVRHCRWQESRCSKGNMYSIRPSNSYNEYFQSWELISQELYGVQEIYGIWGISHNFNWYIPRILCVFIHWGFLTKERLRNHETATTSQNQHDCTDALGGWGQHVIPSKAYFTEHSYVTGICQVYACHIFQLDASESASAARRFRVCLISQVRWYVKLCFRPGLGLSRDHFGFGYWKATNSRLGPANVTPLYIQILFKLHTVIWVKVIALSVWKGDNSVSSRTPLETSRKWAAYSRVIVIVDVSNTTPWSLLARRLNTLEIASLDRRGCDMPSLSNVTRSGRRNLRVLVYNGWNDALAVKSNKPWWKVILPSRAWSQHIEMQTFHPSIWREKLVFEQGLGVTDLCTEWSYTI
jgi:hypothetical protein